MATRHTTPLPSDHVSPASWRGSTDLSPVNIPTCWRKGLQTLEHELPISVRVKPHLHNLLALGEDSGVDILSPCGKLLLSQPLDPEDTEDELEPGTEPSNEIPSNRIVGAGFNTEMEDALYADMPESGKKIFDSFIALGSSGAQINKASFLSSRLHAHKTSTSTDRLKRYQGVPRYNPSASVLGAESALGVSSLIVSDPIVSLLRHQELIFLCFGEVLRIDAGSQSIEHISTDMLTENDVYVTFQLLELVPATTEDDSTLKHDWRSRKTAHMTSKVRGRLVLPVNPTAVIPENFEKSPFYLFESHVLTALTATLVETLTVNDARSLPKSKESTCFPYKLNGRACFLADTELLQSQDIDEDCCPRCIPAVSLNYSNAQSILNHMAAHKLFDPDLSKYKRVCGLCLSTDGACRFYLKKGKGADSGYQVDYRASQGCLVMKRLKKRFKYASAAQSTENSPCTNVPRKCPLCLDKSAPAIWTYDMKEHLLTSHPTVDISTYRHLWELTDFERKKMEVVWEKRHEKKEKRKSKGKGKQKETGIVISEAHRSNVALRTTDLEGEETNENDEGSDSESENSANKYLHVSNDESSDEEVIQDDSDEEAAAESDERLDSTVEHTLEHTDGPSCEVQEIDLNDSSSARPRRSGRKRQTTIQFACSGCGSTVSDEEKTDKTSVVRCTRKGCETIWYHIRCLEWGEDFASDNWEIHVTNSHGFPERVPLSGTDNAGSDQGGESQVANASNTGNNEREERSIEDEE
ncbi:hypothetical protein K435DRAFT_859640 [Dendrothele bispora CBS 962.96]|uniref:Zinc finger PHD-type domain-containing protein n=1 Tax=Dendrothele bispora (strain CBS 962.96) TaxID=1314807 RepID=A0A4S8M0B8_DENBC|nr:hypothetical protein K435DRAFT_859640 [Dendrothele bispora CBS 962.96]